MADREVRPEKAAEIIQSIRESRGIDSHGKLRKDANSETLERALLLLSHSLNSKPTHFLLELIQNADDNSYPEGKEPCLSLAYCKSGHLFVGCNEVGFGEKNVRAICDVGGSTKTLDGPKKGYIGEKGVGFKSVFKVADAVWISSANFEFMFERADPLGMLVPVPADFPSESPISASTMFCFRIPEPKDQRSVEDSLVHLKAELLLFLNNLVKIKVKIYPRLGRSASPSHSKSYTCEEGEIDGTSELVEKDSISLFREPRETLYSFTHTVYEMPAEEKRQGIEQSDIVISFPLGKRSNSGRQVYCFLPVRSYGFTFLLQADFILTANREEILQNNEWNDELYYESTQAFLAAVNGFNESGICKYDWPRFIYYSQEQAAQGTIFESFISDLQAMIRDEKVLEHQDTTSDDEDMYAKPCSLVAVQQCFTDGTSAARPLLDEPKHLRTYVSAKYSVRYLTGIGVEPQSTRDFCDELRDIVRRKPKWLAARTVAWHERLFKAILETEPSLFRDIALIPLQDGTWVSADDGPLYLANKDDIDIPDGIEFKLVDKVAGNNQRRRKLFQHYGVKTITEEQICERILSLHGSRRFKQQTHSIASLKYHAWYVFQYGASSLCLDDLLLADHKGRPNSGKDLYFELSSGSFDMRHYFSQNDSPCKILHGDYLSTTSSDKKWKQWLHTAVGVAKLPRLLKDGQISVEFRYLIDQHPSKVWLSLLRDNWSYYERNANSISFQLRLIKVDSMNKRSCTLNQAYLGTTAVLQEPFVKIHALIADLPDPNLASWQRLIPLGLRTAPDLRLYLHVLEEIAESPTDSLTANEILVLYSQIYDHFHEDPTVARNAFSLRPLIRIQSAGSFQWISVPDCRWKAHSCLHNITALASQFPRLRKFFVDKLGVTAWANTADILHELLDLEASSMTEERPRVKEMLLLLSSCKDLASEKSSLRQLAQKKIFPVRASEREAFRRPDSRKWFIPDRRRLNGCFEGRIWMLDFNDEEIAGMDNLFEQMDLNQRRLSKQVKEETVSHGAEEHQKTLSKMLRLKADYITKLLSATSTETLTASRRKLENIQVWSSEELALRRSVEVGDELIYGEEEIGRVLLKGVDEPVTLYCSTADIARDQLPWHFIAEQLADYFNIANDRRVMLNSILQTEDESCIDDILERADLLDAPAGSAMATSDLSDPVETSDEEMDGNRPAGARYMPDPLGGRLGVTNPFIEEQNLEQRAPRSSLFGAISDHNPLFGNSRRHSDRMNIIREPDIVASAETWDASHVRIMRPETPMENDQEEDILLGVSLLSSSRLRLHYPRSRPWSFNRRDAFRMSDLASALPDSPSPHPEAHTSTEHEIGYGGELFIFTLLRREIEADESCWTSRMRSRHFGLSPFTGLEGEHSDFTLEEPVHVSKFRTWLCQMGFHEEPAGLFARSIRKYHLEVKTTLGDLSEPFVVSNNQMKFCQTAHNDPTCVYIILRVYRLNSTPRFEVYIDPWALMMSGKLQVSAQGGYLVRG